MAGGTWWPFSECNALDLGWVVSLIYWIVLTYSIHITGNHTIGVGFGVQMYNGQRLQPTCEPTLQPDIPRHLFDRLPHTKVAQYIFRSSEDWVKRRLYWSLQRRSGGGTYWHRNRRYDGTVEREERNFNGVEKWMERSETYAFDNLAHSGDCECSSAEDLGSIWIVRQL
jgi:hypothetical protein